MEREAEFSLPHTNKLDWDYRAFVQYALGVIALIEEREKAENLQKHALEPR
jgi:hypothetical protein